MALERNFQKMIGEERRVLVTNEIDEGSVVGVKPGDTLHCSCWPEGFIVHVLGITSFHDLQSYFTLLCTADLLIIMSAINLTWL